MKVVSFFTTEDLVAAGMSANSARLLVRQMLEDGDLVLDGERSRGGLDRPNYYRLVLPSHITPRAVDPVHYWQFRAWTSMRVLRRFTALEIQRTMTAAGAEYRQIKRFCADLELAGILRATGRQSENGAPGSHTIYLLSRDVGPEPPSQMELRETRREVKGYV